jgi:hypothetical protein
LAEAAVLVDTTMQLTMVQTAEALVVVAKTMGPFNLEHQAHLVKVILAATLDQLQTMPVVTVVAEALVVPAEMVLALPAVMVAKEHQTPLLDH